MVFDHYAESADRALACSAIVSKESRLASAPAGTM